MFRYRVEIFTPPMFNSIEALEATLNEEAGHGWRVISVSAGGSAFVITLEKPISSDPVPVN